MSASATDSHGRGHRMNAGYENHALQSKPLAKWLVMIVFALAAIGVAFAEYARGRTEQGAPEPANAAFSPILPKDPKGRTRPAS